MTIHQMLDAELSQRFGDASKKPETEEEILEFSRIAIQKVCTIATCAFKCCGIEREIVEDDFKMRPISPPSAISPLSMSFHMILALRQFTGLDLETKDRIAETYKGFLDNGALDIISFTPRHEAIGRTSSDGLIEDGSAVMLLRIYLHQGEMNRLNFALGIARAHLSNIQSEKDPMTCRPWRLNKLYGTGKMPEHEPCHNSTTPETPPAISAPHA